MRFPDVTAYLDLLATMIELGELGELARFDGGTYIQFDPDGRWRDALADRLVDALPLRGVGDVVELDENVRNWPEHWLLADGLTAASRTPRGATTTVAGLLRVAAEGAVCARNGSCARHAPCRVPDGPKGHRR